MISSFKLVLGKPEEEKTLAIDAVPKITVLVGPNNCGKSALLRAINERLQGKENPLNSALKSIEFDDPVPMFEEQATGFQDEEIVKLSGANFTKNNWREHLSNVGNEHLRGIVRSPFFKWMGGKERLRMLPAETNPSLTDPQGPLAKLFVDDDRRKTFQSSVYEGIKHYPVIDSVTSFGKLALAFSKVKPDPIDERTLNDAHVDLIQDSITSELASDGFVAYVGILGALHASNLRSLLIDEPEAFLHPPLSRILGKQIASHQSEQKVVIATHSSEFLMGVIEAGTTVTILRLQYEEGLSTVCKLESDELKLLMNDPMLRSANVLSGLFAKAVVVTEADTDRAFYQEINSRLLAQNDPRGIDDCVFLNAQNKQTVPTIVGMLRKMGVPAVGVVDLDVLSEGGENWSKQIRKFGVPTDLSDGLGQNRKAIAKALAEASTDDEKKDYKRRGGLKLLPVEKNKAAEVLLRVLRDHGLFVVPNGEVEAWLPQLGANKSKHRWLREIFASLGADASLEEYVQPSTGDVWDFIGGLNSWLKDPKRLGM